MSGVSEMLALAHHVRRGARSYPMNAVALANHVITLAEAHHTLRLALHAIANGLVPEGMDEDDETAQLVWSQSVAVDALMASGGPYEVAEDPDASQAVYAAEQARLDAWNALGDAERERFVRDAIRRA